MRNTPPNSQPAHTYKLVLLGESAVGKSSIVVRFVRGDFSEFQESTIGAAFLTKNVELENFTVRLEIWDTAGQERYQSLAPMYYRGSHAAIVVYDITSTESYDRAIYWVNELQKHGSPRTVIAFVGNKLDLEDKRVVESQVAKNYADANNLIFMEVSAKTATNVYELFSQIAEKMPELGLHKQSTSGLAINTSNSNTNPKSGCC